MSFLLEVADELSAAAAQIAFDPPVRWVYSPLDYARAAYARYVTTFGSPPKQVVFVGMNPGPWGMVQTGIPFGDPLFVRRWMGIEAPIGRPAHLAPSRPVMGFQSPRREVSGARLWGWAESRFGTASAFFARCMVLNYCPLAFFDGTGRNLTPDRLPKRNQRELFPLCDEALRVQVRFLGARGVVAVGTFVRQRAEEALVGSGVTIVPIPHPSPANPGARRGWEEVVDRALLSLGVI